jgi:flavin reductase (DIM6/NTAB) family NADH-FMN oxidoreductase RutF
VTIDRAAVDTDLVWPDEGAAAGPTQASVPLEVPAADALRSAFGRYATGITLVTCLDSRGAPCGLTVNSFSSLSLEPPLVLWSLRLRSTNLDAFTTARHFAVNVLSESHLGLSRHFATQPADQRFSQGRWRVGLGDAPVLEDAAASFECALRGWHDEGDHRLFIGQVGRVTQAEGEPLVYHGGAYRRLGPPA